MRETIFQLQKSQLLIFLIDLHIFGCDKVGLIKMDKECVFLGSFLLK